LFLVGGIAALVPVLPIAASFNQYAYVFSALTTMVVAAAWTTAPRWGRAIISLVAVLSLMHGMVVLAIVRHVGEIQAVFSPALADVVAGTELSNIVRLRPAPEAREWIFRRLTHNIPSYRGIPIGERVRLVAQDSTADYTIEADGRLTPTKTAASP
jgi:hypothetical protein